MSAIAGQLGRHLAVVGMAAIMMSFGCENKKEIGYRPKDGDTEPPEGETEGEIDSDTNTSTDSATDSTSSPGTPAMLPLEGDLRALDPTIMEVEGVFHLFYTGRWIPRKRSVDLIVWEEVEPVFGEAPEWIARDVPEADEIWAPDISFFGGFFHMYYGASSFGSNHSCIGHATAEESDVALSTWTDRGAILCSQSDEDGASDDWNAIDPNVVLDEDGVPFMVFGSYWTGIKAVRLTLEGDLADGVMRDVSSRGEEVATAAPLIVDMGEHFFHFVSFDQCCVGVDSTHNIRVGRSGGVLGPFLDRDGVDMLDGGGTLMVQGDDRWRGPGHNAVLLTDEGGYNVFHAYDSENDGMPTLRISTIAMDSEGWPLSAGP